MLIILAMLASNPIVACGILAAALMKMAAVVKMDNQRVKDGKDPISLAMFDRVLQARDGKPRTGGAKKAKRPGMSGYLWERWLDAWDDALAQHKEHREQRDKDRIRAKETGTPAPKRPSLLERLQGWRRTPADKVYVPEPAPGGPRCDWCEATGVQLEAVDRYGTTWQMCPRCKEEETPAEAEPARDQERAATPRRRAKPTTVGVVHDGEAYDPADDTHCPDCGAQAVRSPASVPDWQAQWCCWNCSHTCDTCQEPTVWARPTGPAGVGGWYLRHTTALGNCPGPRKPAEPQPEPTPQPAESEGRHRTPDPAATTATGDVNDIHTCEAQMNELMETLGRIADQVDVIDGSVRDAGAAGERMSGFLASKNVPDVEGLDRVAELLNPEALKALYDALEQAANGLDATHQQLTPLREAAEKIGDADGSATNGR